MSVKSMRAGLLGSTVSVAIVGLLATTVAWADDSKPLEGVKISQAQTGTTPAAPPAADDADDDKQENKVERVVVTGSRLKKSEFTSSSPVQIITREESTLEGLTDTSDILQGATVASGSFQIDNTLTGFTGFGGGSGANTVSLRGLGAERTLVLLNGRRIGPAGVRGIIGPVDLNTIPSSMIDRAEILKDGGSSIYGSDAVAGVINIITRRNTDGAELDVTVTQPFEGGGETITIDGFWGKTFDKGFFTIGAEYHKREALRAGDRDYYTCSQDLIVRASNGQPLDLIDPATGVSKCFNSTINIVNPSTGGLFVPFPTAVAGGGFLPTGITGAQPDLAGFRRVGHSFAAVNTYINNLCIAVPATAFCATADSIAAEKERRWRESQGLQPFDSPKLDKTTIVSPAERYSIFLQGAYDILPGVEAYGEFFFNKRESEQKNFFNLAPTIVPTRPGTPAAFAAFPTVRPFINRETNSQQDVDFYRTLIGVRGELGERFGAFSGWSYDLFAQRSTSEGDYGERFIYNDRFLAASSTLGCNPALLNPALSAGVGCVAVNWFAPDLINNGNFTAAEEAFLFGFETGHTHYEQTIINGSVTGDAFQLPAGMVAVALGFEVRGDEIDDQPGPNALARNFQGFTTAGRTAGEDAVREVFGEASIPIFSGLPFAEDVTLSLSGRYTDYDSYGDGATYKAGINWQITPEYRVRGTTGTSFRAPALYEMFLANQVGFQPQTNVDPCINWATSVTATTAIQQNCAFLGIPGDYTAGGASSATILIGGGGPGVLEAETSEMWTAGFIWTPDWIDFNVAVDYWEVEIVDQVARFGAAGIVRSCMNQLPPQTSEFCALFTRNLGPPIVGFPTFAITQINDSFVNLNTQTSRGLDLTTRFVQDLGFGTLRLNSQVTWTFQDETLIFATSAVRVDNGDVYEPDWTAKLNAQFDMDEWTFFWNTDLVGRASDDEDFGGSVFNWRGFTPANGDAYYKQYTEFHAEHDTSIRYRVADWTFLAGVSNVFDEPPPTVSFAGTTRLGNAAVLGSQYDLTGRAGFFSVTKSF